MSSQTMVGRGIAAVGVACGLIAIWVNLISSDGISRKYWDDGTLGGLLLILGIVAALLLLGAVSTNRRNLDVAVAGVGATMLGLYLWYPALFAFDQWKLLDTGAWLGVCSALIAIGAVVALSPSMAAPTVRPAPIGTLLALVGLVLVLVGIWTKTTDTPGTYWNIPAAGHSLGVLLLILVVLSALAIGAAHTMAAGQDAALVFAGVTLGLTVFLPVDAAFNNFGQLRLGGWLAAFGGLALLLGVVAMRQLARGDAPAPAMATPAPPAA